MKGIIRGLEPVDYKKKETEEIVKGVTLHLTCPDNNVLGEKAKEQFIRSGTPMYKVISPYLEGGEDLDEIIGAKVFIDYDVSRKGNYTISDVVDLEILSLNVKEGGA